MASLDSGEQASFGTLRTIGEAIFTTWLLPFEAVSLLLLVAMVGAVVVAKSRI
jgi:NADH-quinone oxidoreductase subunit J